MRPRTAIFGTLGVLAMLVGLGLLFVPDLLLGVGPVADAVTALGAVETTTVGLVAGLLVLATLAITARSRPTKAQGSPPSNVDSRFDQAATAPTEAATATRQTLTAEGIDQDIQQAIEAGGDQLRDVRSLLRETATSVYAEQRAVPESHASERITRGEWTDDPVAAEFLAGDGGPTPPLVRRLRLWLAPTQERKRRIQRTIAAIERVSGQ